MLPLPRMQLTHALPEKMQPSGAGTGPAAAGRGKHGMAKVAQQATSAVGGAAHKVTDAAKAAGQKVAGVVS